VRRREGGREGGGEKVGGGEGGGGGEREREKGVLLYRFAIVWDATIASRRVAFQEPIRGRGLLRSCGGQI
jgi:hypothetical protein